LVFFSFLGFESPKKIPRKPREKKRKPEENPEKTRENQGKPKEKNTTAPPHLFL